MKIVKPIVFLVLVLTAFACKKERDVITEKDVKIVMSKWQEAYKTKNPDIMNTILNDNWEYSGKPDGTVSSKEAAVKELKSAGYQFLSIAFEDLHIDYYEDVAIVKGKEQIMMKLANGDTLSLKLRFTDVYQKKQGVTKALATHSSPITNQ